MNFKKGQKIRVKVFDYRPNHWNPKGYMDSLMGKIMTISYFMTDNIYVKENSWCWRVSDFEKIVDLLEDDLFEI